MSVEIDQIHSIAGYNPSKHVVLGRGLQVREKTFLERLKDILYLFFSCFCPLRTTTTEDHSAVLSSIEAIVCQDDFQPRSTLSAQSPEIEAAFTKKVKHIIGSSESQSETAKKILSALDSLERQKGIPLGAPELVTSSLSLNLQPFDSGVGDEVFDQEP